MRTGFKGGQLQILTDEQIHDIYRAILNLLANHGVRIEHEGALKILKDSGAFIDVQKKTAKIPEYLVEESIKKAPKSVKLCGRDKEQDFTLEGKKVFFGSTSGCTIITDPITGERRATVTKDIEDVTKVFDALDNYDYVMGAFTPLDAPRNVMGLYEQDSMMSNTVKHTILYTYHGEEMTRKQIEIARLIGGGEEELRKRPICSRYNEPTSPLVFGEEYVEALLEWAKEGLPAVWAPCPMGGATAPITLAGILVQGMAESLAGNVLVQLVNPGTPFICGFVPLVMDMKTSLCSYGAPEDHLLGVAEAQLAQFLEIPLWGTGGCTDAKILDAQTFVEASMNLTAAAFSGQNLIHDIGLIEGAKSISVELLVICDEIIGMLKRFMSGIDIDDDTLALETIEEAGHGGSFLGLSHTRRHFHREQWIPPLMDRTFIYETWKKEGGRSLVDKARDKIKEIVREHEVEPIPKDIKTQIEKIKKN